MSRFNQGDRVRIDIPDKEDPDFDAWHGRRGVVVSVLSDDARQHTGDKRDAIMYRVEFEDGKRMDFRWRDLRPIS